jgi:UDP-N-acetylglucosamine 2-epimerase (non-hydrolysing)
MGIIMKTIVTITGIRPDFIRMSKIFKKLDNEFNHILVHTGQHYDKLLSDVFFDELEIRKPDYNLEIGGSGREHFHQTADISVKSIELFRKEKIRPDIILFLGDSNSVTSAVSLKKEGYKIGHIEAGMRSGDKRMLEEINRIVCDHCSDIHFVYHENYRDKLIKENLPKENIYVVGNTIVEVCNKHCDDIFKKDKTQDFILMDIHRPENFKYEYRLKNIITFGEYCSTCFELPVRMLKFTRTIDCMVQYNVTTNLIEFVDLMPYKKFLQEQYNAKFIISDSGTAQEEPALLNTSVIVPRDYTERPESICHNCSFMLNVNVFDDKIFKAAIEWIQGEPKIDSKWLGNGTTADKIITVLRERL